MARLPVTALLLIAMYLSAAALPCSGSATWLSAARAHAQDRVDALLFHGLPTGHGDEAGREAGTAPAAQAGHSGSQPQPRPARSRRG